MAEISESDITEQLEKSGITLTAAQTAEFAAFANYLENWQAIMEKEISKDLYEKYRRALSKDVSPAALEKARDMANKKAEIVATNMTKTELAKLGNEIAKGLEEGLGVKDIARKLESVKGLDSVRAGRVDKYREYLKTLDLSAEEIEKKVSKYYEKELRKRKRLIATTEARDATATAREIEANDRGAKYKVWITVGDSRVSDIDLLNEEAGAIPINKPFPSGHMRPPSHPNCRCTLAYYTSRQDASAHAKRSKEKVERVRRKKERAKAKEKIRKAA